METASWLSHKSSATHQPPYYYATRRNKMFLRFPRLVSQAPSAFTRFLSSLTYAVNDGSHFGDALSTSIETVDLCYEKHLPLKPSHETRSPLIFLHGLFGSKANTRSVCKKLANSMARDIYCLDLRNFGHSPHTNRLDYPLLAADVEKFIDDAKFDKKPILVGHSMGAKTVMAMALRRPDLPKMVVSVDNAPVGAMSLESSFGKYIRQLRYAMEVKRYTNIKDVEAELAIVEPSQTVRQFLLTNVNRGKAHEPCTSRVPLDVIGEAVTNGSIAGWPYDPSISRWSKGPVLVIRGTKSTYVPDEAIPDIGRFFPDFEVRDIEAGHWVISEKPAEFASVLQEFVARREDEEE